MSAERYGTQASRNQLESAKKSGARAAIYFDDADSVTAVALHGKMADAPRLTMESQDALRGRGLDSLRTWLEAL
jgi:hypothetical protein